MCTSTLLFVLLTAQSASAFDKAAVLAEATRQSATNPAYNQALDTLRGIDPTYYLTWRKPEPEVGRELVQLRLPAEVLIARYYAAPTLPLSDAERMALVQGLLMAIGKSEAPVRGPFLASVARDEQAAPEWRERAARELGYSGSPEAFPTLRALATGHAETTLRAAAASGLGAIRTSESLEVLTSLLGPRQSEDVQRSAVAAIGVLGSYGVRSTPDALRARAAHSLLEHALFGLPTLESNVLEALSATAHPTSRDRLLALASDKRQSKEQRALAERALRRVTRALARSGI